jgi:hypothetical protein
MKKLIARPAITAFAAWVAIGAAAAAAPSDDPANLAPNPRFTAGQDAPTGWSVARGKGRWIERTIIEIQGTGHEAEYWQSAPLHLEPGRLYRFETRARRLAGTGGIIAGPEFANRDYTLSTGDWHTLGHVFRVPDGMTSGILRLGVWESSGTVQFDTVSLVPVLPVDLATGNLRIGEGESVVDSRYVFAGTFEHEGSNHHRPLVAATAHFNSDRWIFAGQSQVTYRFEIPGHAFREGTIGVNVSHHVKGECLVEVSGDGQHWRCVATVKRVGTTAAHVPVDLLPARSVWLRLRPAGAESYFQVNAVNFDAGLEGQLPVVIGETAFAAVDDHLRGVAIGSLNLGTAANGGKVVILTLENRGDAPVTLQSAGNERFTPARGKGFGRALISYHPTVPGHSSRALEYQLMPASPGRSDLSIRIQGENQGSAELELPLVASDYERADYGARIAGVSGPTAVWWCDATHKIPRERAIPDVRSAAATLSAARNDHEAVQVVVQPTQLLKNLTAKAGDLLGPAGATIPATRIEVLREYYHLVRNPTDATGARGWWPDALPPLARPIDVAAGTNQPLWVLIDVPTGAAPGDYAGNLSLKAEGWAAEVPLRLHVWNVTLPERNHLTTAFGFSPGDVFRYQNIRTEADKRQVLDLYFRNFAAHRISPYDPTPLDPIRRTFRDDASPPRAEFDFKAFDAAMEYAISTYHFTNFSLHIEGMGGGTFASRDEPRIGRHRAGAREYEALFSSEVRQLADHLRAKGWLGMAYVYWFDEPEPKDYAFVRAGMDRIKKFAPDIPRMLTEEPGPELAGAVDIWCPVTPNYSHDVAESYRARGDRFWWYVCTGPKAPYCTLFIDHPATELRVWLWQTWQHKVVGNLVWASNWWTSSTAFPDAPQNPYDDPMSYTDGYGIPRGTKAYWGNGDGRFLYPPESAAVPGRNGGKPVIEPPVSSLRWEMLREGVEDYEMLYQLRDLLAKRRSTLDPARLKQIEALLEVPADITRDMTTFTTDPAPIYARRGEVARAIEELSR